jgi:2-polyprenyl-6-methoxyphenol hydroxylase-like FAD-dependent oxidoreductase
MMTQQIGGTAIVIGAGIAGLSAAAALSPLFAQVIVLERDELPAGPAPRPGVAQGRHPHLLLVGGLRGLEQLFPGIGDDLAAAGAVRYQVSRDIRVEQPGFHPYPQRDFGFFSYAMSRPLLETVVRRRLAPISNVTLRTPTRVLEIVAASGSSVVQGVRIDNEDDATETLSADLVIDASGRGVPTLSFLKAHGLPLPQETSIGIDVTYATAKFAIPDSAPSDWKVLAVMGDPRGNRFGGGVFPLEGRRWMVTLAAAHGDKPPGDPAGFMQLAQALRTTTIYDAIRSAARVEDIERFAFPASVRRHFERLESFPRGLLPLGDAICHFNPIFGQGMSVAAIEACELRRLLTARSGQADPLGELAAPYFAAITPVVDTPWGVANLDFVFPQTRGVRPEGFDGTLMFSAALNRLAARDPDIHKLTTEIQHFLRSTEVYRDPAFMQRIQAEMAAMHAEMQAAMKPVAVEPQRH